MLNGIRYFTALTYLDCGGKSLTATLEPGQSLTAPFVKTGFFGRTKAVTWI